MYTAVHSLISAKSGENVQITFTVTDQSGTAVALDGANAVYKIARHAGDAALLSMTDFDGIALVSNTAVVEFNTGDLTDEDGALTGDFFGQLTVTQDGDALVVAEGPLSVGAVIS